MGTSTEISRWHALKPLLMPNRNQQVIKFEYNTPPLSDRINHVIQKGVMPDDRRTVFSRVSVILKLCLFARKYALRDAKIYLCVKRG